MKPLSLLVLATFLVGVTTTASLQAAPRLIVEVKEDLKDDKEPVTNRGGKGDSFVSKGNFSLEVTNRSFDTLKLSGKVYILSLTPHGFARGKEPKRNISKEIDLEPFELTSNQKEVIDLGEMTFRYDVTARPDVGVTYISWKGEKYEGWVVEISSDGGLPQMFYSSRQMKREFDKYRKN